MLGMIWLQLCAIFVTILVCKITLIALLIRNQTGQVVDAIGRSLIGRLPKWKRYGKSRAPLVIGSDRRNIVIVEDVISAIKLSNILPEWAAMPILGTSLSADAVTVISSFKNGLIALDKDATDKAIQMHRRLAPFLDRCRVVMLECDIKDDTEENIRGIFQNARTDGRYVRSRHIRPSAVCRYPLSTKSLARFSKR